MTFREQDFINGFPHGIANNQVRGRSRNLHRNATINRSPFFGIHDVHRIRAAGPHLFALHLANGQGIAHDIAAHRISEGTPELFVECRVRIFGIFIIYNKVRGILDTCKGEVRQFIRIDRERDILVFIRIFLEANADVVVSRRKCLRLGNFPDIDRHHREIVRDDNACIVNRIESLERHATLAETASEQHKVRRASFQGRVSRSIQEVARESLLAHNLPDFLLDQFRVARKVRQEHARLGLQVHRGAHLEVRLVLVAFRIEDSERISLAFRQSESIQLDLSFLGLVLSADIHHKLVVDEHPHIVVTQEFKVLALHIFELGLERHGKAVVMSTVLFGIDVVVHRVRHRLRRIQILEVIQEEQTLFGAFGILLSKPESVFGQVEFQLAASGVGVGIACGILGNHFGNEPVFQMVRQLTVAREIGGTHRDAIRAQLRFDHSLHDAVSVILLASAGTEVLAGRAGLARRILLVAFAAMQPVEHHHRKFLDRAVAQFTREFRIQFGVAIHGRKNPYGIGNGENGIELDFVFYRNLFLGDTILTDIVAANRLIEINIGVLGSKDSLVLKPSTISFGDGSHIVALAAQHNRNTRIGPRGKEPDCFRRGNCNDRLGGFVVKGHRSVFANLYPDFVDGLILFTLLVFGEQVLKERLVFSFRVQVGFAVGSSLGAL